MGARNVALACGLVGALAVSGWLIANEPAPPSFAVAIAMAIGWSIWLERDPEETNSER